MELRLRCPRCRKDAFELRMLNEEGVGTVCCAACERHFLLLDSEDYWFDVIQSGYPRLTRCTCQGSSFQLVVDYRLRDDGDVEQAIVSTCCVKCRKTQRRISIDIDYSPTQRLITRPLVPCKNPQILYDLQELTLYARSADIVRIAEYLSEQRCTFAGTVRERGGWRTRKLPLAEVARLLSRRADSIAYSHLYVLPKPLAIPEAAMRTAKKEDRFWKRAELIRISSPMTMVWGSRQASLYYIQFANEFIQGQTAVAKSSRFRQLTKGLGDWLQREFVSWRGRDCFDNKQLHLRLFGKKYSSGARASRTKKGRR